MPAAPEPFAIELAEREASEPAAARAARLANLRWLTVQRLWAALDRAGITDDSERIRFMAQRLWPGLAPATLEQLVSAVGDGRSPSRVLARPTRAADIVGELLEGLMRERGYPVAAATGDGPTR